MSSFHNKTLTAEHAVCPCVGGKLAAALSVMALRALAIGEGCLVLWGANSFSSTHGREEQVVGGELPPPPFVIHNDL